jgi:putative ABC transport system permease protein
MGNLMQDVKYGLRQLRRSPGFTAVAILTLALGIGATTAIFSVINTVLLQPLPYPHPDRLVQLGSTDGRGRSIILSVPDYMAMRQATRALEDFALYDFRGPGINLTSGDRPEQLKGIRVSANYFQLFGATLALGHPFSADEDRPGGPHVAVISYGLWQSRFGGSPDVAGKTIELGAAPFVIVGVLSRDFRPDPPLDIWLPLQADPESKSMAHYLLGAARLKPGATVAAANAELGVATAAYKRKFPVSLPPKANFTAFPMQEIQVANIRPMLLILLGAVAFVLLIACANVANLLLARATLRKREIAIRAAVGAGRGRIVRQLLTESVLLSLGGGALGLVLGFTGVRGLLAINPGGIPRIGENGAAVALDWRVLLFTLGVAVLTGILFGLIPALNASRSDLQSTLKESGARQGTGFRHNKSRSILVVTEVALALVLLTGAALLIRTLYAMRMVHPGFDSHNVLTMQMSLTGPRFAKTSGVAAVIRQAEQQVESVPGVVAVSISSSLPLAGQYGLPFNIIGRPPKGKSPYTGGAEWAPVSPEFFKVFRIPIHQGRAFTDLDDGAAPPVVIINEAFAKHYWPKESPVGQQMIIGKGVGPAFNEPARLIVGVVGAVHDGGLNRNPPDIMYIPVSQMTDGVMALNNQIAPMRWAIRTRVAPYTLRAEIQEKLRDASGGLPVAHFQTMDERVAESTAQTDFNMVLLCIFAGVALVLAGIGIYGLIAYSVEQRTQEIGIRMALGAQSRDVRKMVVRQGMLLALIGVAIGVGAALGLTRLMASMLFGVKAWNPLIYITVAVLLSLIAFAATYLPARRAAKVDPMDALRYE